MDLRPRKGRKLKIIAFDFDLNLLPNRFTNNMQVIYLLMADGLVQRPVQSCLALGQLGGHGQGHSGGDGCHDDGGSRVLAPS